MLLITVINDRTQIGSNTHIQCELSFHEISYLYIWARFGQHNLDHIFVLGKKKEIKIHLFVIII
jgi:hypothetical protein